jgi:Cohesin domain
LHFSGEKLSGTQGSITVTNADGVEVAAYLGNVTDTGGPLSLQDAGAVAAVAGAVANTSAQTIPGFGAFPNLDPAVIGDVSLQGSVNSTDAGAMTQQVGGTARPTIPYAPIGLTVTPVGPDPTLSVPTDLMGTAGGTVVVPVNIDTAHPLGSEGMMDAMLALSYDPQVFEVSASDVELGTVPEGGSGWQLKAEVNAQTGQIGVEIYSNTPIQSVQGGSLVTISMHVRETATAGATGLTLVPYVDPTGGLRVYQTQVSDGQGAFVLHPAETALGVEPGAAGVVTIGASAVGAGGGAIVVSSGTEPSVATVSGTVAQPGGMASASVLPAVLVEQVFGNLEQTGVVAPDGTLVQPGAILSTESSERGVSVGVRDLSVLQGQTGLAPAEWLPEDSLAYLGLSGRGQLLSGTSSEDGLDQDGADLGALDAVFARETDGRFRLQ